MLVPQGKSADSGFASFLLQKKNTKKSRHAAREGIWARNSVPTSQWYL